MDNDPTTFVPRDGMTVIGSDGERVGTIDFVTATHVVVSHGIFPHDHYIPQAAIASHDDDAVYLTVTKAEALERGFANPGVTYTGGEDASVADAADGIASPTEADAGLDAVVPVSAETAVDDDRSIDDDVAVDADVPLAAEATVDDGRPIVEDVVDEPLAETAGIAEPDLTDQGEDAHRTIELHEEELSVTTRPVERGVVRATKKVVEENVDLEVPVVEEEVVVTRRRVEGDIAGDDYVFEEGDIEIPLLGQDVEVEKHAKVVEEIDIARTAHERIREVTETVRRETAEIEGDAIEHTPDADSDEAEGNATRA